MPARFNNTRARVTDANGNPVPGAQIETYYAGTSTPKATYTDAARTTAGSNPIVCDAGGLPPERWLASGPYKFVYRTAEGALLHTDDEVPGDSVLSDDGKTLTLDKAASGERTQVQGKTAGVLRWSLALGDAAAETGSNAGSDFTLSRYADNGTLLDSPLKVERATGNTTFGANVLVSKADPKIILDKPASGTDAALIGRTNGANRWALVPGNITAETGSNVGSDFFINRYDDAGNFIDSPFTLNRATGEATFSQRLSVPYIRGGAGDAGTLKCHGTNNTVNFRWDSTDLLYRVDESVERTIAYTSDARVKANLRPTQVDALALLKSIPLYAYEFRPGLPETFREGHREGAPIGLTAQDLEAKGLGSLVVTTSQPEKCPSCVPQDLKAVRMEGLVPYLIRAVQQQQAQIEELRRRVAALEGAA